MQAVREYLDIAAAFGMLLGVGLLLNWFEAHGPIAPGAALRREKRRMARAAARAKECQGQSAARSRITMIDYLRNQGSTKRLATSRVDAHLAAEREER